MQQEAEFEHLSSRLGKYGYDDDLKLEQTQDRGSRYSVTTPERGQQFGSGQKESGNKVISENDRFQAMKSGLQVRSTLMKMSQNN